MQSDYDSDDSSRLLEGRITEKCAAVVSQKMVTTVATLEHKIVTTVATLEDKIMKNKKKIACMFWTIIILLFIMTIAIVGVGYMLYNVQVTVVVHHNTTFIKNTTEQCPVMEPVTEPFTNTTSEQCPVTDSTTTDLTRTEQTLMLGTLLITSMSPLVLGVAVFGY